MNADRVDYVAVFQNLPTPALVLTTDFMIMDANAAHMRLSGKRREEVVGRPVVEVFPDNPSEPGILGPGNLGESLRRVVETGEPDTMPLQRYDVEVPEHPGTYTERYWCAMNVPVHHPNGEVDYIIHVVEEIPDLIRKFVEAESAGA
jgi:PAS domain S-box-containing protein